MSTTFAIFRKKVEVDQQGEILSDYDENDYVEIAFRGNRTGIRIKSPFEIVFDYLPGWVPVYPLDNSAQGIFCVSDIRKEIEEQNTKQSGV